MVETFLLSLIFSMSQFSFKLGKINIHKESYDLRPLFKRWSVYPVVLMALFYVILQYMILQHNYFFLPYQKIIKDAILFSYMILGYDVLYRNGKYKEIIIACCSLLCGFLLNGIVMHFNGNKMPIFPDVSYSTGYTQPDMIINASKYSDFHVLGDHTTNLIFLSDIFDFGTSIWSAGDILCRLFAFIIVYYSIKTLHEHKEINIKLNVDN